MKKTKEKFDSGLTEFVGSEAFRHGAELGFIHSDCPEIIHARLLVDQALQEFNEKLNAHAAICEKKLEEYE